MSEKPWADRDSLNRLYNEENMSIREVADELGCSKQTVQKWMEKLNVPRRDRIEAVEEAIRRRPAAFRTSERGYEVWQSSHNGRKHKVKVHRLVAVAEWGFNAVVEKEIHHKNGVPWDNRTENIEPLTAFEHAQKHRKYNTQFRKKVADRYENTTKSSRGVGDEFGISHSRVLAFHEEFYSSEASDV